MGRGQGLWEQGEELGGGMGKELEGLGVRWNGGTKGLGDRGMAAPQEVWEGAVLSPTSLVPLPLTAEPWLRAGEGCDWLPWVLSPQFRQWVPESAMVVVPTAVQAPRPEPRG